LRRFAANWAVARGFTEQIAIKLRVRGWRENSLSRLSDPRISPDPILKDKKRKFLRGSLDNGSPIQLLPDWLFGRYTAYVALPTRKLTPARTRAFVDFAIEMMPKAC
jgi:hypothetical protein